MEAQVLLDQLAHRLGLVLGEPQRLHPLAGELGADHVVVVEGDHVVLGEPPGAGLADVVHQRRQPRDQVGAAAGQARLEVDRLLQHRQAVLVDVLVPVVLVALQREGRQLGQDVRRQAGLHEQPQAGHGVGRQQQLDQLVAHPLGRDDADALGHAGHRRHHLGGDLEAELGGEAGRAHHPQRVVGEGVLGPPRGAQHAVGEVDDAAERVLELLVGQGERHRVDREVAAGEVADQRVAVLHGGLAALGVVGLRAVRRDLDLPLAAAAADGPEGPADVPHGLGPALDQALGDLGGGRGGEVEVVLEPPEHRVADGTADQRDLLTGCGEASAELVGDGRDARQLRDHARLDVADQQGLLGHGRPL